jgi:hypothetical protein
MPAGSSPATAPASASAARSSGRTLRLVEPSRPARYVAPRRRQLVAEIKTRGRPAEHHRHATRLVVDDFGDAVGYEYRCSQCMRWGRENVRGWCRDCKTFASRQRRRAMTAAERQADRERKRELRERRLAENPEARRQEYERTERARQERLRRDPEREREMQRRRARRYQERIRQDPERYQERLEKMRIDNGLRRMRNGQPTGSVQRRTRVKPARADVAAAPLAAAILRWSDPDTDLGTACEAAGTDARTVRGWRSGERRRARFAIAERILVALDLHWWDVFDPASAPGVFSGVRSRDVVAWCEAALSAAEAWGDA